MKEQVKSTAKSIVKEAKENVRGAIKTTDKDIAKTALLAKGFREAGQTVEAERAETEDLFLALIYYGTSLLFIVIGNYLPKIKQNNTIGIRIVLTLQDEENWNATHSFSRRIWGTSGILCMLCTLHLIKSVSKEACIFCTYFAGYKEQQRACTDGLLPFYFCLFN